MVTPASKEWKKLNKIKLENHFIKGMPKEFRPTNAKGRKELFEKADIIKDFDDISDEAFKLDSELRFVD